MTLLELAKQYESDVEDRISCIKDEWHYDGEVKEDCNMQIRHWETTLRIIRTVIKENS